MKNEGKSKFSLGKDYFVFEWTYEDGDGYINASDKYLVPPIESLRALCEACHSKHST